MRIEIFLPSRCREYEEHFEIQLTAATGGAVLGTHLVTRVTIAKSDSPNGLIRFLNESLLVIPNSNITQIIMLALDRTGGLVGAAEVRQRSHSPVKSLYGCSDKINNIVLSHYLLAVNC